MNEVMLAPRISSDEIRLESYEFGMAAYVGMRRAASDRIADRKHRNQMDTDDVWRNHIEGACGELAAAKFLNIYWSGSVDTFQSEPDLKPNIEVKTRSKHSYELLVRKCDDLSKTFVLVTGLAPNFRVRGWLSGQDACRDEWWLSHAGRPPAWFVPSKFLNTDWSALKDASA